MWTDKKISLIDNVPEFYKGIYEYQQLFNILDSEILLLKQKTAQDKEDLFLATASNEILLKYENMLLVTGEDTEEKRQNIINKMSEFPPFSYNEIEKIVKRHISHPFIVNKCKDFVLSIKYRGGQEINNITNIVSDIYNIIPANVKVEMTYDFYKYIDALQDSYSDLSQKTWNNVLNNM